MAIQFGATVYDLEESELCYAPPFGSREGPGQLRRHDRRRRAARGHAGGHWGQNPDAVILDVREKPELAVEGVPGSIHIPLGQLRTRLDELPTDTEIHVLCRSGQRAFTATRILLAERVRREGPLRRDAVPRHADAPMTNCPARRIR